MCAWQRHWHKSLDRKRCEPCCAHNNFYVAIKRRLLPRRFVCPFGFCLCIPWLGTSHCKLKSKSVSPATGNRQPATGNDNKAAPALVSVAHHLVLLRILWLVIISMCAGWHSVCRAAGQSASLLLSSILLYSVPDPVSLPSCVSALVDHRPQCKYVESLVRILCSFLCSAL